MQDNIQAGLLTELMCEVDFTKFGIVLYAPIVSDSRSDFIAEINSKFIRIQCKSAIESSDGNSFSFTVSSSNWNTKSRRTYKDEVDYFYTYHKNQGYLVPIEQTGNRTKTLRLFAMDSNNPSITWAKDYQIEKVLLGLDSTLTKFIEHKQKEKSKNYCVDCGAEIRSSSTRCKSCNGIYCGNNLKKDIPISREELKSMIRANSFCSIGKTFDVSDNAIRKWCDKFNLPRLKSEIKKYSVEEWEAI